ncbi:hypothetical protein Ahy_A01g004421 [Arachis hypogaea]|uniref:RNase H type-1 domain-containing protein n=1 Tax=Arachis hypogaea TaxID=3818 RepID=A0A445EW15_ARAHY|nr:hypothetical protein Ahy_A01g004421 [Arachis hypogaea]
MMVQSCNNRKKPQVGKKYLHANQDTITIYSPEEGNSPKKNNPNSGSCFDILQEENPKSIHEDVTDYEVSQDILGRNGPQVNQAQVTTSKIQVQKRTIKPSARKNPQNQQKSAIRPKSTIEPGRKKNIGKNKSKTPGPSTANPKRSGNPMEAAKGKENNFELEGMEMVVSDYMKRMERDRWDALNALKDSQKNLEKHVIRENLLFNPDKQQQPTDEPMENTEARGNQVRHLDDAMIDAGGGGTLSASSSQDQVGPMLGARSRWPITWKRGNLAERLDRGLSNLDWQLKFLESPPFKVWLRAMGCGKAARDVARGYSQENYCHFPLSPWKEADHIAWGPSSDGTFSTKTAYQGPERIRTFLWLVTHNTILTNSERKQRHLTSDDSCPRCRCQEESAIHVLRDCFYAKSIWQKLFPPNGINCFFNTDLNEWLLQNLMMSNNTWSCLFDVAVSTIWYLQNKLVFDGESVLVTTAVNHIRARSEEFGRVARSNLLKLRNTQNAGDCPIRWSRPEEGCIKVNVDCSWFSHKNNAACGSVFRDSEGRFLKGFSCNLGICSIMHAKLWAVIHGLNIATTNGYHNLVVESDSAAAINFIKRDCSPSHPCAPLVQDICILAARVQRITWIHSFREANPMADLLVKKGQGLPVGLHLFDQASLCISYALLCDFVLVMPFFVTVLKPLS